MTEPDPPSPVERATDGPTTAHRRTVLFTAVGAVLAAALLFAVVTRVSATRSPIAAGTDGDGRRVARFDLGRAQDFAPTIARSGPLLFPDPQGRSRDIFVQHLGGADWLAFEARATGTSRQCVLRWEHDARRFVDPCDGRTYPPDGAGLVSFPTRVNDKGRVIVDLGNPVTATTATTAVPTVATTTTASPP